MDTNRASRTAHRVVINDRYNYDTDLALQVGEKVLLPRSNFGLDPWVGEVTSLTATYDGPCKRIVTKVSR